MFLINRGELEARLDVEYYQPKHFELLNKLLTCHYPLKRLKDVSNNIVDGPFGSSVKNEDYVENGIPFLRVADITHGNGSIGLDKLIFISPEIHQKIIRSRVFPNDVVIAKTGATMGAASIVPETIPEANIRGDLAAVTVNNIDLANYIANFINTPMGQDLFWRLNSGATRGRVVISNLRKYPIIIPPDDKIEDINNFIALAKQRKKQKLTDAQTLLNGIDDYLLTELGIKRPEAVVNTLENRIFTRNFSEISGGRFDAFYYQNTFNQNINSVLNASYPAEPLKNIIKDYLIKGKLPKEEEKGGKLKVIQINSIKKDGNINTNKLLTSENIFYKEQKLINNDVLIVITGATIGKIAFWNIEGDFYLGGDLVKFQTKKNINPYFIYSYLRFTASQIEIKRNITGATNGHLSPDDIKQILIPLPPIEKQTEIANHIQSLREQAKHLQQQAETELQQAKCQVEKMILGEDDELSN